MQLNCCVLLSILCACAARFLPENRTIDDFEINYRLDNSVIPTHYKIHITPYLENNEVEGKLGSTFDGYTRITLHTQQDNVQKIVLHIKYLDILSAKFVQRGDSNQSDIIINVSPPDLITDKVTITLDEPMKTKEDYFLSFIYTGHINRNYNGFYSSQYLDSNFDSISYALTQLEAVNARQVFPCFDEPKFKAIFSLQINHDNIYNVISNTKLEQSIPVDGLNRTISTFKPTPIMSTYLLAFFISNFPTRGTEDFVVLSRPEKFELTKYSYEIGPPIIKLLDEFTGIPYKSMKNMEKMHLAAIPDFFPGGMENWGLLTFHESVLLVDSNKMKAVDDITGFVAHEIAHMWFGNLVTCEWWGYIWLNEGFARFMQFFIAHEFNSALNLQNMFIIENMQMALSFDSFNGSHALTEESIQTPDEINEMFSELTYSKGASFIRMVSYALGEHNFKTAIQNYLKKYQYKSVTPDNLFNEFQKVWSNPEIDLKQMLYGWTEKPGYPLVTVTLSEDRKSISFSQRKYYKETKGNVHNDDSTWIVPISYTTNLDNNFTNTEPKFYLQTNQNSVEFNEKLDWVIVNIQQTGFYRVNYDLQTWSRIQNALKAEDFSGINVINRAQIIDDLFYMCDSGIVDFVEFFKTIEYLEYETNLLPWLTFLKKLIYLNDKFQLYDEYQIFMKSVLEKYFHQMFNKSKDNILYYEKDAYTEIVNQACRFKVEGCLNAFKGSLDYILSNNKTIPYEMDRICCSLISSNTTYFDRMLDRFKTAETRSQKNIIIRSLNCVSDKSKFEEYLHFVLNEMNEMDKEYAFGYTYIRDKRKLKLVLDFIRNNYVEFQKSFNSTNYFEEFLIDASQYTFTKDGLEQLINIYEDHKTDLNSESQKNIQQAFDVLSSELQVNDFSNAIEYLKSKLTLAINQVSAET